METAHRWVPVSPMQPSVFNLGRGEKKNLIFYRRISQLADDGGSRMIDPFAEMGLSATAAEEKLKIHAKEKKKAPQMDWIKKYELFSNF